jgi:hypothetical protein
MTTLVVVRISTSCGTGDPPVLTALPSHGRDRPCHTDPLRDGHRSRTLYSVTAATFSTTNEPVPTVS